MAMQNTSDVDVGLEASAALATLMPVNPVSSTAWIEILVESARFVSTRVQTDLETRTALMACKTPAELMEVQAEFLRTALQQYADQTARVINMTMNASKAIAEDMKRGRSRGYDDVPV
ncbi:phasin family protein [Halodurantibacterium flavum]|uniref:Phasin family protein n=1 Tax=Halodurantibacterium flavum TaxID=1382802 RepID=A0ABW4S1Q8_9RHOB